MSWYSDRVAKETGRAPQQYVPPQQQPPPQYPQHPQGFPQQQNPGYQQPPPPQQQVSDADFIKAGRTGADGVTPMDVLERAAAQGGKGTRTETSQCPECGGNQYFQRRALSKMGAAPAPYCHSCGYNGLYEQYGAMDVPLTMDES